MHVNNYELVRPDQALLDQCTEVFIGDPAFRTWAMKRWCWENNISMVWSEQVETSDVSVLYDHVAVFYFVDPADATAFGLKFAG